MEEAPTPIVNIDKQEKIEGIVFLGTDIYQVDFIPMNKGLMIKCHDTGNENNNNEAYSYKLTEDEIIKACGNYSNFINKLKANASAYLELEKSNNSFLLTIFSDEKKKKRLLKIQLQVFNEEDEIEENINNLHDAIKAIKFLINENKSIKKKLVTLQKDFEDYKKKMNLNFLYNSFDSEAYKLENIYNNLSSKDIIQNEFDFCLINQGIQHLFKKSIVNFECIYKAENLKFNDKKFDKMFKNSEYSIIIISTQDNDRRFGAFFKRNFEKDNNVNNMGINNLNNQQMNVFNKGMIIGNYPPGNYPPGNNPPGNVQNQNNIFGMGNQNYQINNNNNPNLIKIIFNSSSSEKDYYVFSFDSSQIFYSNNNIRNNIIPSFSIELNNRILKVKENPLNLMGYKLSGAPESNILTIELYSVQFGYL